jgi:hypothetical protein
MWTNNGLIFVSSFAPGTGTLTVTNGGTVSSAGGIIVRVLGTLRGDGQIIGNVGNVGVVAPGLSPGALSVTGDYTQVANGVLEIELAGTTADDQFDQLLVNGAVALDGTLDVSLIDGFGPTLGMSFDILDFVSLTGTFDTLMLPALSDGLAWDISQLYVTGVLSVGLLGDFNNDGVVDAADYTVWQDTLGSTTALAADGDASGAVDPGDYDVWKANFGQTAGSGLAIPSETLSATVPEPATFIMLLIGMLAMSAWRGATIS